MCLFNWITYWERGNQAQSLGIYFRGLLNDHPVYYSSLKQRRNIFALQRII